MRDLWQRLENHLKKHAPIVLDFLNPPATENEIREAEQDLGFRLAADLADSYRIHNGQARETGKPPHIVGFIPNEFEAGGIYRAPFGELLPLSSIVQRTNLYHEMFADLGFHEGAFSECEGPVRRDGDWSFLFITDGGNGDQIGLDMNPEEGGEVGQVLSIMHDPASLLVLAPSFRQWFSTLVERFESGRYYFSYEDGEPDATDKFDPHAGGIIHNSDDSDGHILRFSKD